VGWCFEGGCVRLRGQYEQTWLIENCVFLCVFCAATAMISSAQTFNVLTSFDDGFTPDSALVQGTDGSFYGTTTYGGAYFGGTVFRITAAGELTTIYNFCELANCPDGRYPAAGLVPGKDGFFYGMTAAGGTSVNNSSAGTIFKISPGGELTTLYSFCAQTDCADGEVPVDALVQGTDGNFYGTALQGGEFSAARSSKSVQPACLPSCTTFVPLANAWMARTLMAG
jgi:uncharacterized repeat protein (TIGR03803 family)